LIIVALAAAIAGSLVWRRALKGRVCPMLIAQVMKEPAMAASLLIPLIGLCSIGLLE